MQYLFKTKYVCMCICCKLVDNQAYYYCSLWGPCMTWPFNIFDCFNYIFYLLLNVPNK